MKDLQHSEVHRDGNEVVFVLPTDLLNLSQIREVQDEWMAFVESERPKRLVLDMKSVEACGSDAISGMIRMAHVVREYGGEISVRHLNDRVREVLKLSRLLGTILPLDDESSERPESSGAA